MIVGEVFREVWSKRAGSRLGGESVHDSVDADRMPRVERTMTYRVPGYYQFYASTLRVERRMLGDDDEMGRWVRAIHVFVCTNQEVSDDEGCVPYQNTGLMRR